MIVQGFSPLAIRRGCIIRKYVPEKMNNQTSSSAGAVVNTDCADTVAFSLSYATVTNNPRISEAYDKYLFLPYVTCLSWSAEHLLHVLFTLEPRPTKEHTGS